MKPTRYDTTNKDVSVNLRAGGVIIYYLFIWARFLKLFRFVGLSLTAVYIELDLATEIYSLMVLRSDRLPSQPFRFQSRYDTLKAKHT